MFINWSKLQHRSSAISVSEWEIPNYGVQRTLGLEESKNSFEMNL